MKKILPWLLILLPIFCCGQISSNTKDLNDIFDKAIRNDTNQKVVKTSVFPKSEQPAKAAKTLVYSKELKLWDNNLKEILDNPGYSESDKIAFIKAALADTSRDGFEYINSRAIEFWRSSKVATELIEQYFVSKSFENSDNVHTKYKHFEFITKNLYPQAYDSIIKYFNNRKTLVKKYRNEGELVQCLIKFGKEKEAVLYLEILVNDFLNGQLQYIGLGDREPPLYEGTIFDRLCFSDNREVAAKATELLFHMLESKDYGSYTLYPLTEYLDRARHLKLLSTRFKHFAGIDFSKLDTTKLNDRNLYYKMVPEGNSFFSWIFSNSFLLGEVKGREMWKKFVETMPYWKLYGQSFEMSQMRILEGAFKDTSLSQKEMRTMLMQCKKSKRLFSESDYYGDFKARFLRLLCKAYPDKKVPKEDFNKLQLSQILTYSLPLQITSNDLRSEPFRKNLTPEQTDSIVSDFNTFAKNAGLTGLELTKKERFNVSLQSAESCVYNFFVRNNRMIHFDAESASVPVNYIELFETEFQPVLQKAGITNIEISQTTKKINDNLFHYNIYVKCNDVTYMYEHTEEGTDWYTPQRLIKLLNLCLMQNNAALRLVEVESGDQTSNILLIEPRTVKSLLNKYSITSWAIDHNDDYYYAQ